MEVVNLTPHAVTLFHANGSTTTYPPSGEVARVEEQPGSMWAPGIYPFPIRGPSVYGELIGLPPRSPELTVDELAEPFGPPDRVYIVSLFFADRLRAEVERAKMEPQPTPGHGWWEAMLRRFRRDDVVTPGDLVRDDAGRIIGCKNVVAAFR